MLGIDVTAPKARAILDAWRRGIGPVALPAADRLPAGRHGRPPTADLDGRIVGRSRAIADMTARLGRIARADAAVLISGENGAGKDLVARAVHDLSARRAGPFVSQNCSALQDALLESGLFGHVRGAFTGAVADRRGLFEAADGGTLFLDEVGDMSPALQAKLLRVIEDSTFVPVGSVEPRRADVRVVAATNHDLAAMVRDRAFREDLFHRLSVLTIEVPPLRDRRDDIPLLVEHFLNRLAARYGGRKRLTAGCMKRLAAYRWPGNVRELAHEVERLWVLSGDERAIGEEHLSPEIIESP